MAGASFACPFARLPSCKYYASRNLIRGVKGFDVVCRRHVSSSYSSSADLMASNGLPASLFHHSRSRPFLGFLAQHREALTIHHERGAGVYFGIVVADIVQLVLILRKRKPIHRH
ncbi:hypothetical protein OS493_032754 [Desmophyllum pertusum]|uniref:Uncharacterized protein n=1 Tax=Desmophyllum pertusum TaxID=174260 RepID=A0A9W9ZMJ6_9CNID|nr:hypothetical protein OS493_032754 [Desmophyllum pertusum]